MYYDVMRVKHLEGYKLEIVFENGKKGIVNLQSYVKEGGVFSRFSAIEYFRQAHVDKELGVLCWPDGLDIAPETLYSKATGESLPAWMVPETPEQQTEESNISKI